MKIVVTEGSQVILESGVAAGDQLVIDGQEKLRAGSRVIPHASKSNVSGAAGNGSTSLPGTASAPSRGTGNANNSGASQP